MEKRLLFAQKAGRILAGIITITGLAIFGYLMWYSFRYTYNFVPDYSEMFTVEKDSMLLHAIVLAACVAATGACGFIGEKISEKTRKNVEKAILFFVMAVMTVLGFWWVSVVHAQPCTDQKWVVEGVCSLMDGDYTILKPDQYFGTYIYQLGLAVIFRFLFTLSGLRDYHVVQYCNVLCVPVIILAGYKIVKNLGGERKAGVLYCLFALTCFPLLFYTPFVYGEIFSVMAGMVFVWLLMDYVRSGQKKLLLPVTLCSVLGVLTRGNFWIVIIAAGIILALYGIKRKDAVLLLLLFFIAAAPAGVKKGIELVYEQRSGIRLDQGIPVISTLAMGVHDEGTQPAGWSNLHDYYAYTLSDCDRDAAAEFSREYLRVRIGDFRDGSADWKAFYKEKLLTQWVEPTWQCLLANHDFAEEPNEFVNGIYYGKLKVVLLKFLNEYQWLLYGGVCLFFWFCWKEKKHFYMLLPEVILIGGALFSLLWEAKTRYIFPYMLYMLPCAAVGLKETSEIFYSRVTNRKEAAE